MKKLALVVPALLAAVVAVSGCAKSADDANVTVLNDSISSDAGAADGNFAEGPVDLNADTNLSDAPSNAS